MSIGGPAEIKTGSLLGAPQRRAADLGCRPQQAGPLGHILCPASRTSYQIAHAQSLCVRPCSSPPERDHSQLPSSPPHPRRGLPREAPRTRIREVFQPEHPPEFPGTLEEERATCPSPAPGYQLCVPISPQEFALEQRVLKVCSLDHRRHLRNCK